MGTDPPHGDSVSMRPNNVSPSPDTREGVDTNVIEEGRRSERVTEAYAKMNIVQWEWPKVLPKWQRNAVAPLLNSEALVHPDHPLRQPGDEGIRLYNVTETAGYTRLSLSLQQLEYLQYYVHEMRLADPVWVGHITQVTEGSKDRPDKDVGSPVYPEGEEWISLPDVFIHGNAIARVEPAFFTDAKELKRYLNKQHKDNKKLKNTKSMYPEEDEETEKVRQAEAEDRAKAAIEEEKQKAWVDNNRDGPGLRRGPDRKRAAARFSNTGTTGDDEDGEEEKTGPNGEALGWGGFPIPSSPAQSSSAAEMEKAQNSESALIPLNPKLKTVADLQSPAESDGHGGVKSCDHREASSPDDDTLSTSAHDESQVEQGPVPITITGGSFTTAYYAHAQQALLIATLGGMLEAQKEQPLYIRQIANVAGSPPIGRSLFMSLRVVTWEADEETVLEVGWSAIWWQEKMGVKGDEDNFEEMRDVGHIRVSDHLADKKNGLWKPNYRSEFRLGDSIPIAGKDIQKTMEEKIEDLSMRAGGGPIYVVLHSADGEHADPTLIGINTKNWYRQFKPASWSYPAYHCVDGIGKTFIIDTAILFAAIEYDPKAGAAPIKTQMTLEEIAWFMFGGDDVRRPEHMGNAGNDAFYNLEVFVAMMTSPSLKVLREDFKQAQEAPSSRGSELSAEPSSDLPDKSDAAPPDANGATSHEPDDEDDDYSDDEMIKGVFCYGPDGEIIQIE